MKFQSKTILPILIISLLYLLPRLINLQNNFQFRYDQGLHLLETFEMVQDKKIRLLGPAVTSKVYQGRQFFIGPYYYYILGVLGVISNWNPITINILIIFIELIFYLLLYFLVRKKFGFIPAATSLLLICFSPYLISHSTFFWNPHFLIPISILFLIYINNIYLLAFIWGFAFSFHYAAIFWLIPIALLMISQKKFNIKNIILVSLFFIIGNLPYFVFELKHNFYNIRTMLLVFTNSKDAGSLTLHYFFYPLFIFSIYSLLLISKKYQKPYYLIILLFFFIKYEASLDKINSWNYPDQIKARDIIIQETCPSNFNIASTIQGDTRFYDLRYLLTIKNCIPSPVDSYPNNDFLYLIKSKNKPLEEETVWEVNSFKPLEIIKEFSINNDIDLVLLK
jgi:hypothetical protein